jgi:tRNA A37 threonylcarbamoyladenosine biosynthesis protein TsaE
MKAAVLALNFRHFEVKIDITVVEWSSDFQHLVNQSLLHIRVIYDLPNRI